MTCYGRTMGTPVEPAPLPVVLTTEEPTIAKAVIAGVTALGGQLITALSDGHLTATEIVSAVVFTAVAAASVWAVSNTRS